jgi:hypothetical protein
MLVKLLRWLIFGVAIALMPIVFGYVHLSIRGGGAGLTAIVGNGELLIVVAAMCAAAVGELLGSPESLRRSKIAAGGASVILLMLSSLYYADVAAASATGAHIDAELVAISSMAFYFVGLICCASCVVLSEL